MRVFDEIKEFAEDEEGIGVVEIVLILVVLIALVVIFKDKISVIIKKAFSQFETDSNTIIGD